MDINICLYITKKLLSLIWLSLLLLFFPKIRTLIPNFIKHTYLKSCLGPLLKCERTLSGVSLPQERNSSTCFPADNREIRSLRTPPTSPHKTRHWTSRIQFQPQSSCYQHQGVSLFSSWLLKISMLCACYSYVCILHGISKNERQWKSEDLVPTISVEILAW